MEFLGSLPVEDVRAPLVASPSPEYPNGFGLRARLSTREAVHALFNDPETLVELAGPMAEHGAIIMDMCGPAPKKKKLEPIPSKLFNKTSMPFHLDISASLFEGRVTHPSIWQDGFQLLWQNPTSRGRNAATVCAPTSAVHACYSDKQLMISLGGINLFTLTWDHLMTKGPRTPTEQVMEIRDHWTSWLKMDTDNERMRLSKRTGVRMWNESIEQGFRRLQGQMLVQDWAAPENRSGTVMLIDGQKQTEKDRPLLHARWNWNGPVKGSTVYISSFSPAGHRARAKSTVSAPCLPKARKSSL